MISYSNNNNNTKWTYYSESGSKKVSTLVQKGSNGQ